MPCDTLYLDRMTRPERKKQIAEAVAALDKLLASKEIEVTVGKTNGAVAFVDRKKAWQRNGVTDVCAFRKLQQSGSAALRQALARAEAVAGRKMEPRMLAAGTHSHDGGNTWDKGH